MAFVAEPDRFLVIPDLQIPFEARHALKFCIELKKEFRIPDENVLNVGDEVDEYFGSIYQKDPNGRHTPTSELNESKDKLKQWAKAFPHMKIAESNHGQRWAKKAAEAQIPSQMMRRYQEVLETPDTWRWQKAWKFMKLRNPFQMLHGVELSGKYPYRQAAEHYKISTVFGHLTQAGIAWVETDTYKAWGMCVSALINRDDYAFHYAIDNRFKAPLGVGLILDSGSTPIWIPYPYAE